MELTGDNHKTDRLMGDRAIGCWLFEVTENMDLYSYFFDSLADAEAYVADTDNKCQILVIDRTVGFGDTKITILDHT